MKLQILITQYDETDEVAKPLLDSIAIQQNVDFEKDLSVIIVNDGSDTYLSDEFLDSYPFTIEYHLEQHGGLSAARANCFKYATADYVMFCDVDDMFYNSLGLFFIFQEMDKKEFDGMCSVFIEEYCKDGKIMYITHNQDTTFVHGKIYRRQFLIDEGITWNNDLKVHEDSYFNIQALMLAKEKRYMKAPFYLWKYRKESTCRRDPKYILKTYHNLIQSCAALARRFVQKQRLQQAKELVTSMVYDTYLTMQKADWWLEENKELRDMNVRAFRRFFDKHKQFYKALDDATRNRILHRSVTKKSNEGVYLVKQTFDEWMKEVETCDPTNTEVVQYMK